MWLSPASIAKRSIRSEIALLCLLALSACDKQTDAAAWANIFSAIEHKFPEVPHISTEELNVWVSGGDHERPLVFDARRSEEYAVSHLVGAHLYTAPHVDALLSSTAKDRRLVVYCSVGWRSAKVVQQLQTMGYTNSYNLKGSIFKWANHELPLVNEKGPTRVAHPYGSPWSRLLNSEYRAEED